MSIGTAIKHQRRALGLSQSVLAKQAGVSQPYLSQVEAGTRRRISVVILRRLADALGVAITDLLEKEAQIMPRSGRTEVWLYQMSQGRDWTPLDFCREVREGRLLPRHWNELGRQIYRLDGRLPQPGDLIVLSWAPTGADAPGLCGFGVITEFGESRQLRFRALPPTETLQNSPRWNPSVRRLVEEIRTVTVGTMCRVREARHVKGLLGEMFEEFEEKWLDEWARKKTSATAPANAFR